MLLSSSSSMSVLQLPEHTEMTMEARALSARKSIDLKTIIFHCIWPSLAQAPNPKPLHLSLSLSLYISLPLIPSILLISDPETQRTIFIGGLRDHPKLEVTVAASYIRFHGSFHCVLPSQLPFMSIYPKLCLTFTSWLNECLLNSMIFWSNALSSAK